MCFFEKHFSKVVLRYDMVSYTLTGLVIVLFAVGIGLLIFDTSSTECQTAELTEFAKIPICGKGAFLLLIGVIVILVSLKYGTVDGSLAMARR